MAINEKLTDRVREFLEHIPNVEEKKMFRGITFMVNDKMCISVGNEEIMCRIDPEIHEEAIMQHGCRTVIMKGKEYKGYIYVHEDVLNTKKEMAYWVQLALNFNLKAKATRKK
jgi:TfoX/Sxy family transcriptional regulator of competence genes